MFKIKRLVLSFTYAIRGFKKTWKEEQNLQIQSIIALLVMLLGFLYGINRMEWIIILMLVALVMLMELANSAIERIADVFKPRISSYVKEIKDISAAAVMLSSVVSVVVGFIVFWPYL